jgi:hypothetical protein
VTLSGRELALFVLLATVVQLLGCGKRGPPQAPFVRIPAPMGDMRVHRLGDEVHVGFTLPIANVDGSAPADLERIEVYAMTIQPRLVPDRELDLEEFMEEGTLVGTIEALPAEISEMNAARAVEEADLVGPPRPIEVDPRPAQGFPAMIVEKLTSEKLIPIDPWEDEREEVEKKRRKRKRPIRLPLMTPPQPDVLQRQYAVVGISTRGEEGEAAERVSVPLVDAPKAPSAPVVTYTAEVVNLTWKLPIGVRGTVQEPIPPGAAATGASTTAATAPGAAMPPGIAPATLGAAPGTTSGAPITLGAPSAAAPTGPVLPPPGTSATTAPGTTPAAVTEPTGVIGTPPGDVTTPDTTAQAGPGTTPPANPGPSSTSSTGVTGVTGPALPKLQSTPIVEWPPATHYDLFEVVEQGPGATAMPFPLNLNSLEQPIYVDKRVEFGVERCYGVLSLDEVAGLDIRSVVSTPTCVTFIDTFPPDQPEGLTAVGSEGAVSLIWEPNEEEDLAGYLVLRGVPLGETLRPLTLEPVIENTYRDTTGEPGVDYVYVVIAVDTATPPNESPPSAQVQERPR